MGRVISGEGKSAVATPDGKSRKKKFLGYLLQAYQSQRRRYVWCNGLRRLTSNLAIFA